MTEAIRPLTVLIIDDEKNIRATLSLFLKDMECRVTAVDSADAALAALAERAFDLVFLDLRLGQTNGLDLIPKLLAERPGLSIILAFTARTARRPAPQLSRAAEQALLAYQWPGNVRELRNAIERAVILWRAHVIEPEAFSERIAAHAVLVPRLGGDFTLEEVEREHILRVISRAPTLEEAARVLDIESSTLWRKRKRYDATVRPMHE